MTDFDVVFFIGLHKATKVTWTKKNEKEQEKGAFLAKNILLAMCTSEKLKTFSCAARLVYF